MHSHNNFWYQQQIEFEKTSIAERTPVNECFQQKKNKAGAAKPILNTAKKHEANWHYERNKYESIVDNLKLHVQRLEKVVPTKSIS